ncbi:DPP4 [Lepeophtheirus salmonis]|uniref:DPP4 n=1 Tax=Lepeophtheirus salmonis TaxID=72036 RepID=A0A7R8D100_LEPSM|nr:DPP4 [Lepeophtheirus salmonis]CAF2987541.1 DPP4 [Lepeophtheirus salmonis]
MFSRARRLFNYGNLDGDVVKVSANTSNEGSVTIENTGILSNQVSYIRPKKWIMIISAICLLASITLIAVSVSHQSSPPEPVYTFANSEKFISDNNLKEISLNDVTERNKFWPRFFNGSWISDHEITFYDKNRGIYIFNVDTLQKRHVVSGDMLHPGEAATKLSSDQKYLLIESHYHSLYRASSYAQYRVLDLDGRTIEDLKPSDADNDSPYYCRLVSWAPKGNALVYIDMDNNIHYRSSALALDTLLTTSGINGKIFNGIPDWVFEEEIFESNSALWWSPDGKKIVWGSFNDTLVESMILQEYGNLSPRPNPGNFPYPRFEEPLRYPKVGTTNPSLSLWLANLDEKSGITVKQLSEPSSLYSEEVHFSRVTWVDSLTFAVDWMNRVQNKKTVLSLCGVEDLDCVEIFQRTEAKGWIESAYKVFFNPNPPNRDFLTILPDDSTPFRYRQVFRVLGNERIRITNKNADIVDLISWNKSGYLYYTSTLPDRSTSKHFFRIWIPQTPESPVGEHECLSCNVPEMEYLNRTNCSFF